MTPFSCLNSHLYSYVDDFSVDVQTQDGTISPVGIWQNPDHPDVAVVDLSEYTGEYINLIFRYDSDSGGTFVQVDTMAIACAEGEISLEDLSTAIESWEGIALGRPTNIAVRHAAVRTPILHWVLLALLVSLTIYVTDAKKAIR